MVSTEPPKTHEIYTYLSSRRRRIRPKNNSKRRSLIRFGTFRQPSSFVWTLPCIFSTPSFVSGCFVLASRWQILVIYWFLSNLRIVTRLFARATVISLFARPGVQVETFLPPIAISIMRQYLNHHKLQWKDPM